MRIAGHHRVLTLRHHALWLSLAIAIVALLGAMLGYVWGHAITAQIIAVAMIGWIAAGIIHRQWRLVAVGITALFAAFAAAAGLYLLGAAWALLSLIVGLSEQATSLKSKSHG